MNLGNFFKLRFKTAIAGMEFLAEVDSESIEEAQAQFRNVQSQAQEIELVAAMIGLELAKPENRGCYLLDEESEKLLVSVLNDLKIGAEHFFNERLGSYDELNNRITPADMGIVFPDGTLRVVWREELAEQDFHTCLTIIKGLVELLLEAQQLPYFRQSEAEFEACDYDGLTKRRTELLFAAGLWPAEDGTFEHEPDEKVQELLTKYAGMTVQEAATA